MYTVKLQDFEGPLDLLLFFIKRDELDIYDIPISRITKEFLDYLYYMRQLDLEIAGEFVVMAAELMEIKVKMLLPPEPGESEETDPRTELVKRLIEYKRFKEMALEMQKMEEERMNLYDRGYYAADEYTQEEETGGDIIREVTFFDLIESFRFTIENMPKKLVHEIEMINISVEEQMKYIEDFFLRRSEATFYELVKDFTERIRIIVTFIALLELIRMKRIIVRQLKPYKQISIMRSVN